MQDAAPAERNMNPRIAIPAAGFQHQDLDGGILGKAIGESTTGGAGTDNNEIEIGHTEPLPG